MVGLNKIIEKISEARTYYSKYGENDAIRAFRTANGEFIQSSDAVERFNNRVSYGIGTEGRGSRRSQDVTDRMSIIRSTIGDLIRNGKIPPRKTTYLDRKTKISENSELSAQVRLDRVSKGTKMNKELYFNWLREKLDQNRPDGPLNERKSRKELSGELDFFKMLLAAHISGREADSKKTSKIEPFTLEPKSGLGDFTKGEITKSLKSHQPPPMWSYAGRNTLGLASLKEVTGKVIGRIVPRPSGRAMRSTYAATLPNKPLPTMTRQPPLSGGLVTSTPTATTALAKKPATPLATRPGGLARISTRSGTTKALAKRPTTALATRPKSGTTQQTPTETPAPTPQAAAVAAAAPAAPVSRPQGDKVSGSPNELGNTPIKDRDPSKWHRSVKSSGPLSAIGVTPGTGGEYGGKLSESSMHSLINFHINKFLKSRHGSLLKNEAKQILTREK